MKGSSYPLSQYLEALLITAGVAIFSVASKSSAKDSETELLGLIFLLMYISFDSFTSQWQDKIYAQYGRPNVDPYQMMLGVNVSAICITTAGLIVTGDIPIVWEFLAANPVVLRYNIITALTSASGQLSIFYTIKEFGPIVFTVRNLKTLLSCSQSCCSGIVHSQSVDTDNHDGSPTSLYLHFSCYIWTCNPSQSPFGGCPRFRRLVLSDSKEVLSTQIGVWRTVNSQSMFYGAANIIYIQS